MKTELTSRLEAAVPGIVFQESTTGIGGRFIKMWDPNPVNNITHNSPIYSMFTLEETSVEAYAYPRELKMAGAKFRKINAKNTEELENKLVAWFAKNADIIREVGGVQ